MNGDLLRGEDGQALVVVALVMVVLIGSIALSVDWGYSLLTRRGAQNEADAAALGAGRYLASSYVGGSPPFDVSQEDVWCEARRHRDLNSRSTATTLTRALTLSFHSSGGAQLATVGSSDCASPGSTDVPAGTVLLRVQTDITYQSLFGAGMRQPIQISTSARVRLTGGVGVRPLQLPSSEVPGVGLSGFSTRPNVAIWPLVKHFDATDYTSRLPCGQYCDTTTRRFTLFPDAPRFGTFSGLVSYAHYSPRERPEQPHQVITESDYTGTDNGHHGHATTGRLAAFAGSCGGAPLWDTNGGDLAQAASCDLPNWFRYGYRGSLAVGTDWNPAPPSPDTWVGFKGAPRALELPDSMPASRASCDEAPTYFLAYMPSCPTTAGLVGDWVETVPGDMTPVMASAMREFIRDYGRPAPNGRGTAVVIRIFLWDCAEYFRSGAPVGDRWEHLGRTADEDDDNCRISRKDVRTRSVDRVHLVSVLPVTIYENDVVTSGSTVTVYAYWGDVFGDAGACGLTTPPPGCDLNPLINSAFLVPDE